MKKEKEREHSIDKWYVLQVLCLSATFSDSAAAQAEGLMRSPSHVRLDRESPALLGVNQVVRRLPPIVSPHMRQAAKETELLRLLSHITFNQCLVFSGSQLRAESVCHRLKAEGWPAAHLTGAQCQTERLAALEALRSHRCRILVATDLAARGLDSAYVNLVVSLDLPPDPPTYLHRAGRAGRYGSRGAAVLLVCGPEEWYGARAIATLANIKLLLNGQTWVNHLATKKVEGWSTQREGKAENVEVEESEKEKKEVEKQEEEEGVEKLDEGRRGVERSEKGEEGEVTRLIDVDHLDEVEARAWLKTYKPYRKESAVDPHNHQHNGGMQGNGKKIVKEKIASKNGMGSERKNDVNVHKQVTKKKMERKREQYIESSNSETDDDDDDDDSEKEEEEGEEKQNTGKNYKKTNKHTHTHTDATQHKQEQNNTTNIPGINTAEHTNIKTCVTSLINKLWHRPPPVTTSYSHIFAECTAQYNIPPELGTKVRVPPWPVQVEASKGEMAALEKYLNGLQGEARGQKQGWDGVRFDALAVLGAMTEGRDAREVLEGMTQQASCVLSSHTPTSSSTPQTRPNTPSPPNTLPTDHKHLLASSKELKHVISSFLNSQHASSPPSKTEISRNRQNNMSSSCDLKQPPHLTEHSKQASSSLNHTPPQPQMVHTATGTRPKEKKQRKKQERHNKESVPSGPIHHNNNHHHHDNHNHHHNNNQASEAYNNNYQGYSQWYPSYEQGYYDYNQKHPDYNQASYDNNQGYTTYNQDHHSYNQAYHTYNQGHSYHQYTQPPPPSPSHAPPYAYTHAHGLQMDAYIKSACKFASMMEYVNTMGRVSLHVAQDYHTRKKQGYK